MDIRDSRKRALGAGSVLTDITPNRRAVDRVIGPNNGVDKLVETSQRGPHHVVACSGVPSF